MIGAVKGWIGGQNSSRRFDSMAILVTKLEQCAVECCLKPKNVGRIVFSQLHNFAVASHEGYGAVSYRRPANEDGDVHCAFLFGK